MRTKSLLRRSIAVAASTALLSGGLASGMLSSAAYAGPLGAPTVTTFSPDTWDNRSSVTITVNGTNFFNIDQSGTTNDVVFLTPDSATLLDAPHEVTEFYTTAQPSSSTTVLTAHINLSKVPPGKYRVSVQDSSTPTPSRSNYGKSLSGGDFFTVYGFGPANASGTVFGADGNACTSPCSNPPKSRGDHAIDITGSNIDVGATVNFLLPSTKAPDPAMTFTQGNPNHTTNDLGDGTTGTATSDGVVGSGYVSTSLLQGNYALGVDQLNGQPSFTPGWHDLQVVNEDKDKTGATARVSQPWFASSGALSPSGVGIGAQDTSFTLTGKGFLPGSTVSVESRATKAGPGGIPAACAGATTSGIPQVSSPAGDGTYNAITFSVTMADCGSNTDLTPRGVTVIGPDGMTYGRSRALQINANPTFPSGDVISPASLDTLGQGAHIGFGTQEVDILGTGFEGDPAFPNKAGGDPAKMTKFDFGPGITATTVLVGSGFAQVRIDVDNAATTGPTTLKAINPDGGTATRSGDFLPGGMPDPAGNPAPITVVAGPQVTKVSPSGLPPSTTSGAVPVTITGTFNTSDTYTVTVCQHPAQPGPLDCTPTPGVTAGSPSISATTLSLSISTNNAAAGVKDLLVTDTTNNGRYYDSGAIGIDSLALAAPTSVPNTGDATLNITSATGIDQVTSASTATLTRTKDLTGQDPIPLKAGTHLTPGAAGSGMASGTFSLLNAAPGQYSLTVVKDPGSANPTSWVCTGCLTVTGANVTVTSVNREPGDKAATIGQGAQNVQLKIVGTNFFHGTQVAIAGVGIDSFTIPSTTEIDLTVHVDPDATTGTVPVSVSAGDGTGPNTGSTDATKSLTITAAPAPSGAPTPAAYGQGAGTASDLAANTGKTVTITVQGAQGTFANDATLDLGPGITVTNPQVTPGSAGTPPIIAPTPDSLTATLAIAENAAPGKRDVIVRNGDGGQGTLAQAFTVNPGPAVLSVANPTNAPVLVPDGVAHKITITGSNFVTSPASTLTVVPASGITVANVVVASTGTITADVTAATNAALGTRTLGVTNSSDKGFGSAPVYVAKLPSAPASLGLAGLGGSLRAAWTAPADNGGAPITRYHLTLQRVGYAAKVMADVPAPTATYTFTGLVNGASYVVSVSAVNAVGQGPAIARTGIAGTPTTLTSATSSRLVTAGSAVLISGKLVSGTAPVSGRTIALRITPAVGSAFTKYVATNTAGGYSYAYVPSYTFTVAASFAGNSTYRASSASLKAVSVASHIVRTSPSASTSSSSHLTTLRISGYVAPNHSGTTVYLYRYVGTSRTLMGRAVLATGSTFTFSIKPGVGTYSLRIYIGATRGNVAAYSPAFTVKRT